MKTLNLTEDQVQLIWTSLEEWQKQLTKTHDTLLKVYIMELQEQIEMQTDINE